MIHPGMYASPRPRTYRPIRPPIRAPIIPIMVVANSPPGSRPGSRSFAIAPTTSPKRMNQMISMCPSPWRQHPPDEHGGDAGDGRLGQRALEDAADPGRDCAWPCPGAPGEAARLTPRRAREHVPQLARPLVELADAP